MKRRGFTLIELMVVIAIIIILAAIAIPNYLSMTARAKRSRVASDFAAIATALETYKTDWNHYPKGAAVEQITDPAAVVFAELTGGGTGTPAVNTATAITPTGEKGPIIYMTENILTSMKNPYMTGTIVPADQYQYNSDAEGTLWKLTAHTVAGGATGAVLERTDTETTLVDASGT